MTDLNLVRSLLFTPGNRPERFAKAAAGNADGVILDLEDAVGPADKDAARAEVAAWLRTRGGLLRPGFLACVRINSVFTDFGLRDLLALTELAGAGFAPDVLLLPKVESDIEVQLVARQLKAAGGPGPVLLALIESGAGLEAAVGIARATPMLGALAFGGADLAADLRATLAWEPMLAARARLVQAASMAGIGIIDVPFLDIADEGGLATECARARAMGFTGKLAIHPRQVDAINAAFTPTAAEVEHAGGVIAAFEAARGGVCTYRGKMIDEPVVAAARRTMARAARAPH
jgi:citrate lyase beta subunit